MLIDLHIFYEVKNEEMQITQINKNDKIFPFGLGNIKIKSYYNSWWNQYFIQLKRVVVIQVIRNLIIFYQIKHPFQLTYLLNTKLCLKNESKKEIFLSKKLRRRISTYNGWQLFRSGHESVKQFALQNLIFNNACGVRWHMSCIDTAKGE